MRRFGALACVVMLSACGSAGSHVGASGEAGASGGSTAEAGASAGGSEIPIMHPDVPSTYTPQPGTCGFDAPAFCDTFEGGPAAAASRSGELDSASWSVVRGMPYNSASFDDAFKIGPALIGQCRAGLSNARVLPDSDVLVCDPIPTIPSRHVLATAAAQNYGLSTYRIRQPFDFANRTGTIKLDLDLSANSLGGWPALIIAQDPTPAPSFDWQERGSGPRNGVEVEFDGGWCNTPHTLEASVYTFTDYQQTAHVASFDCATAHVLTAPDSLNHVEVYLTQKHIEVWASDASPDGVTFSNQLLLWSGDLDLPFNRGYVSLALRNHATQKYWLGSAASVRWDNIGFDGPVVTAYHESSAPDSLTAYQGLPGCAMKAGAPCQWEGDVIPQAPDDAGRMQCAMTTCTYDGEGRNVGYVVPNLGEDVAPVALHFPSVTRASATRARLILAAVYPWFAWNDVFPPPTQLVLRLRVNGGEWHERPISDIEANAFTDFSPEQGGAGASAGLLNQAIDLNLSELQEGDNLIELQASGTWTGTYRVSVTGADLVFDQPPSAP